MMYVIMQLGTVLMDVIIIGQGKSVTNAATPSMVLIVILHVDIVWIIVFVIM